MQVIEDLDAEIDKRINDLILGNLSFFLDSYFNLKEYKPTLFLKMTYASIIRTYVLHKRKYKKACNGVLPNIFEHYHRFTVAEKKKEDFRLILAENGICYKEVQKNIHLY